MAHVWLAVVSLVALSGLAGCAGNSTAALTGGPVVPNANQPVTGYEAASAFAPTGHSMSGIDANRVRVTATGSATTPYARLEKIALARAAEFGVEERRKFFQTSPPLQSIRCGKREYSERGKVTKLPARGYSVVDIEVTYADSGADPASRPSRGTAEALKAEIAAETVPPEVQAEIAAKVTQQCSL